MTLCDVQVGETALIDGDTRTVVSIIKNTDGAPVVVWRGRNKDSEGGCMPAHWKEWRDGKPQNKRRGW